MTLRALAVITAFLVLGINSVGEAATETTLTLEIAPQEARIGDVVEATLTLVVPGTQAAQPRFPNWQRHWGSAEIRSVEDVVESRDTEGAVEYAQKLQLTSFRPGRIDLPPAKVVLIREDRGDGTEPVGVSSAEGSGFEVVSVLPQPGDEELEPKPAEAPRALPIGDRFWWAAGIIAALAAALLAFLLARRPADEAYPGEVLDPWTAFEQALARLAQATDPETMFTGLSLELRRYLGRSLRFPAAESTTTELRRRLLGSGLPSTICGEVIRLLREADSVKFARQSPAGDRLGRCLDEVRRAAGDVRDFLEPAQPQRGEDGEERAA